MAKSKKETSRVRDSGFSETIVTCPICGGGVVLRQNGMVACRHLINMIREGDAPDETDYFVFGGPGTPPHVKSVPASFPIIYAWG